MTTHRFYPRCSRVLGMGHHVPSRIVTNEELEARLNLSPGWIERRTGILRRRWADDDETLTNLATQAASCALMHSGIDPRDIGLVLLATSTPDQPLPPSAPLLAHRLGLNAGAIDMTGACSGFVYALTLADAFVKTQGKPVLVVGANILSRRIDITDRTSAVLFADAAGALLLGPGPLEPDADTDVISTGVLGTDLRSDGAQYGLMSIPPGETTMRIHDGPGLFKAAIETMAQCAQGALRQSGLTIGQIDRFIPHQANARVFEPLCKLLDCPMERMVRTVTDYGNASAATIPLSLSLTHMDKPFEARETVLLTAAGAGLTGGAAVLRF